MHILVAVDQFSERQYNLIQRTVAGWAEVERIPQDTSSDVFKEKIRKNDIVVGWPRPEWVIGTNVRFLQIGSSGWDAYQNQGLEGSGIKLCTGKGISTTGVAEHCVAMMLALVRRLPVHFRDKEEKVFRRAHPYGEVAGSTACIVGLGDIGIAVAKICRGLGMQVIGVVRNSSRQYVHTDQVYNLSCLKEALKVADHVFVTVTGGEENRNLFSYDVLQCLRPDAYFYNVSRGITVDEKALSELLATGRIAGAGIDVTNIEPLPPASPLWSLGDNVLITGHSAGFSRSQPERFCQLVIRNLVNLHENKPLENQVI